jgi:hypothetical protein
LLRFVTFLLITLCIPNDTFSKWKKFAKKLRKEMVRMMEILKIKRWGGPAVSSGFLTWARQDEHS